MSSPYDFAERDGVLVRDWEAIYNLDLADGESFKVEDVLPVTDVDVQYEHDGVCVTVYGEEGLTVAEVKAPAAAKAVRAMPAVVRDSLRELLGL